MKTLSAIVLSTLLITSTLGCDTATPAGETLETSTLALIEGSPEALGLLAFLNAATTTVDVLDYDVPLNRRAARNIIHHRDGFDGVAGTFDDNLFDSVSEVDAVRWVGEAAMASLIYFAHNQEWVPAGDQLLGMWDGVVFTVDEAEATLAFVNASDAQTLDHDLGLDRRAAAAIVGAQPVGSVADLSELYYVGTSALTILKEAALEAQAEGLEERFTEDLSEHLVGWYALHGAEVIETGGRDLAAALSEISTDKVEALINPTQSELAHHAGGGDIVVHPDVIFPESEVVWFGVYSRDGGELLEIGRL